MEELLKQIQQLGRKHDNLVVFQDFIQLMTCGSGALIIAFCETMRKQGFNPQAQLRVFS